MESLLKSNTMGSFDEKYLCNTKKVYEDFKGMSQDLDKAKGFIRRIPKHQLLKYREIVFSEHELKNRESDLAINNLAFAILFPFTQIIFTLVFWWIGFGDEKATIFALGLSAVIFWVWIVIHHYKITKKNRNLYRLLYFLEHI